MTSKYKDLKIILNYGKEVQLLKYFPSLHIINYLAKLHWITTRTDISLENKPFL